MHITKWFLFPVLFVIKCIFTELTYTKIKVKKEEEEEEEKGEREIYYKNSYLGVSLNSKTRICSQTWLKLRTIKSLGTQETIFIHLPIFYSEGLQYSLLPPPTLVPIHITHPHLLLCPHGSTWLSLFQGSHVVTSYMGLEDWKRQSPTSAW